MTFGAVEVARAKMVLPVRLGTPAPFAGLTDEIQNPPFATLAGLIQFAISAKESDKKKANKHLKFLRILKMQAS